MYVLWLSICHSQEPIAFVALHWCQSMTESLLSLRQVHLGRDQITANAREEILQSRREAIKEYHVSLGVKVLIL